MTAPLMKKVLLTGGTGFVGQNIVKQLIDKYELISVGTRDWDLRNQSKCVQLVEELEPDIIIHAAGAVGGIGANKENPGKFLYENLVMGTNLIHTAMVHEVSKFILLGTVCSYPKFCEVPFNEDDLWTGYPEETNAPYGIAKKALMKLIETYHEQYGFNGVNLIPVNMYGPYDHFNLTSSHVIPALILKVQRAIETQQDSITLWGTGQASREFLYAPDCAEAIELAMERDVPPIPINIGTGEEIKICELIETISDLMGFQGELKYDTSKPDGQPRRCLDVTRSKELLGFKARTGLREGLEKTINWYLKERE
jgi:GDP-L-fucose synthase